jgi:hypothetical protein
MGHGNHFDLQLPTDADTHGVMVPAALPARHAKATNAKGNCPGTVARAAAAVNPGIAFGATFEGSLTQH